MVKLQEKKKFNYMFNIVSQSYNICLHKYSKCSFTMIIHSVFAVNMSFCFLVLICG